MLLTASRSISSTEINKAFQHDCDAHDAGSGFISADKNDESHRQTPRVNNTRAHSRPNRALNATASDEMVELLRVNVLYLEGIASPSIPSARVSVWVGFRSSFPPDSMTVQSSSYSSYFLKEGNLLAIESDQVKWTPAIPDSNDDSNTNCYPSGYHGVAFWDSVHSAWSPHLEITITPLASHIKEESQPLLLPDILEFHVCVVCERAAFSPVIHDTTTTNPTWRRLNSRTHPSLPFNKWDDLMEEEHWYKDDEDDDVALNEIHITHFSQEQQLPYGVAHLKVPRDPDKNDELKFNGKILQLPIRVIQPPQSSNERGKESTENDITVLQHSATLSIQVEKVSVPANVKSKDAMDDQRHYVTSKWNVANELLPNYAPNSVKCDEDDDNEEYKQNNVSSARHFHFDKIKGIIPQSKSKSDKRFETQQVLQDPLHVDQGMCKIQKALESSIKEMSDRRWLAVALRQQRDSDPVSQGKGSICGGDNNVALNQASLKDLFPEDQRESDCPKSTIAADCLNLSKLLHEGNDGLAIERNHSSAHETNNIATTLSKQASASGPQKQKDQVSSTRTISVMQRLFCGASMELAEVIHHCDEDHIGIYTMDSQSVVHSIES